MWFLPEGRLQGEGSRGGRRTDESVLMNTPADPTGGAAFPALPVRVFVLNDHEMVRRGLADLLEHAGFDVVGESGSAAEAARLIHILQPDIVVLDDRLPDGTGIEVCRNLRSTDPDVKCLILTGWDEQHAVRAAVLAGASGYVLKRIGDHDALINCLRVTAAGIQPMGPGVRERVAESLYATASAPWLTAMTRTERSVLALMARGLSNHQIGQELVMTEAVVGASVSAVLQKLGFRRRVHLIPAPIPRAWELLH